MTTNKDMFNIRELSTCYLVRITKHGEEVHRMFYFEEWGSKTKALEAAKSWRQRKRLSLSLPVNTPSNHCLEKTPIRSNIGVRGVTKRRKQTSKGEIVLYSVSYRYRDKPTTKHFQVGLVHETTTAHEMHVLRTAILFRHEFEYCRDTPGLEFDPNRFSSWQDVPYYALPRIWTVIHKDEKTESETSPSITLATV